MREVSKKKKVSMKDYENQMSSIIKKNKNNTIDQTFIEMITYASTVDIDLEKSKCKKQKNNKR